MRFELFSSYSPAQFRLMAQEAYVLGSVWLAIE